MWTCWLLVPKESTQKLQSTIPACRRKCLLRLGCFCQCQTMRSHSSNAPRLLQPEHALIATPLTPDLVRAQLMLRVVPIATSACRMEPSPLVQSAGCVLLLQHQLLRQLLQQHSQPCRRLHLSAPQQSLQPAPLHSCRSSPKTVECRCHFQSLRQEPLQRLTLPRMLPMRCLLLPGPLLAQELEVAASVVNRDLRVGTPIAGCCAELPATIHC
jgi:hypothetical protein